MGVFASYPLLSQEQIQIARRASALLVAKGYGATNALHELITGHRATGGSAMLFRPHDHCEVGVALPRASQYSFGAETSNPWSFTLTSTGTWQFVDQLGNVHDTGSAAIPNMRMYVTPNIDTNNTAVGGDDCYLEAAVAVRTGSLPATNAEMRIYNRATGTASSSTNLSILNNFGWYEFDDIPCVGGVINDLYLECKHASALMTISVIEINIFESRDRSQPASDGTATMTAATKP